MNDSLADSRDRAPGSPPDVRLDSWKEIAAHLKRDVSTVQRWEKKEGMPVHRHRHDKLGSVYAFRSELDAWWGQGRQRIEGVEAATAGDGAGDPVLWRASAGLRSSAAALRSSWAPLVAGTLAVLMAFAAGIGLGRRPAQSRTALPGLVHASVSVEPADRLSAGAHENSNRPSRRALALSPDGRVLVFSATSGGWQQLYLRPMDRSEANAIDGTQGGMNPFFSPDGQWLGFWADGKIKKISLGGGPAVVLCDAEPLFGASWGADGIIVFGGQEGLLQVSANGGTAAALTTLRNDEFAHRLPHVLPGGRAVLFTVQTRAFRWDDARIEVLVRASGERRVLMLGGTDARYVPSGHLLYAQNGALLSVPFDPGRFELVGGPVGIVDDVMHAIYAGNALFDTGAAQFDVSELGQLVFVSGTMPPSSERTLVWVDASGRAQPIGLAARDYGGPRVSPDGQRIAVSHSIDGSSRSRHVWIYDLTRRTSTRLTIDGSNVWPVWSPDGSRVAFYTETLGPSNLFWAPADGSGPTRRLTTSSFHQRPASWSPDGKTLVFSQLNPQTGDDIWTVSIDSGTAEPRPIVQTPFTERFPALSSDGRWLAYASNESGRFEVYVQAYSGAGGKRPVSTNGGREPVWARNGRQLFYREPPREAGGVFRMMAVDVVTTPEFSAGPPRTLFDDHYGRENPINSYDVAPDGRFLMVSFKPQPSAAPAREIHLLLNWLEKLKGSSPVAR